MEAEWNMVHVAVSVYTTLQLFLEIEAQVARIIKHTITSLQVVFSGHLNLVEKALEGLSCMCRRHRLW